MKPFARIIPLLACSLLAACEMPTAPDRALSPGAALSSVDAAGACRTVAFHMSIVPTAFGYYRGTMTGDLAGTANITFDLPASLKVSGYTASNAGAATWAVTDGVLGPLAFTTEFENRNHYIDNKPSPMEVRENSGRHRATGGVTKANLEYKGVYDSRVGTVEHDYRGVICP